jgi:hypothetical protein
MRILERETGLPSRDSPSAVLSRVPIAVPGWLVSAAPGVALAAAMTGATYLWDGYRYGIWPQPALLEYVLRFSGQLKGDWNTSLPVAHFVVAHVLAFVPSAALPATVGIFWGASVFALWAGFAALCRSLGVAWLGVAGAALVALPTAFGGFGVSDALFGYFYPTLPAFAAAVCGFALLARARLLGAAAAFGVATMVHPSAGLLAALAGGPAFLMLARHRPRRLAAAAGLFALLATPSLVPIAADQGGPSRLSEHRKFELLAIVRAPHHLLYRVFTHLEYAQTGLWLVVFAVCFFLLRPRIAGRVLLTATLSAALVCGLGAAASEAGRPLLLVQAQTSRLSSFFVLFGIVAGAGALSRCAPRVAPALLLAIPLLASPLAVHLATNRRIGGAVSESAVEAALLLCTVSAAVVAAVLRAWYPNPPRHALYGVAVAGIAAVVAWAAWLVSENRFRTSLNATEARWAAVVVLVAAAAAGAVLSAGRAPARQVLSGLLVGTVALTLYSAIWLVRENRFRTDFGQTQAEKDWSDVAAHARAESTPLQLVLTPPDQDGFRFYAHRPVVVELGTFRYDKGIDEWVRRLDDVTGSPKLLSPALGTNVALRTPMIAAAYQDRVASTREPICRYHAYLVVTHVPFKAPPWLAPLYSNASFDLFRVRRGTCAGRA